jgi:phosphoglycerate dehydrogenase-like enzyme
MPSKPIIVLPEQHRALVQSMMPEALDLRGFTGLEQCLELAPLAEIGWFDDFASGCLYHGPRAAVNAKWINTSGVGLDIFPLQQMKQLGQTLTNGNGLMPDIVGEWGAMGALILAKRFDMVLRAHDRQEWLPTPPSRFEMLGSSALIIGYGQIGSEIGTRLRAFGVKVTGVRRNPGGHPDMIGPDDWRARLAEFDFIILAAPGTAEISQIIGAAELAAMKPGVRIVNISRGALIDQPALIAALESGQVGSAFLDPTTPEPLPADDPLWKAPNIIITMHLSGAAQSTAASRGAARFVKNLRHYLAGEPLEHVVDFDRGY